jgi:hypothetical protein
MAYKNGEAMPQKHNRPNDRWLCSAQPRHPLIQTFEPDRVLLMPDGALDVWSKDYLDLVALD